MATDDEHTLRTLKKGPFHTATGDVPIKRDFVARKPGNLGVESIKPGMRCTHADGDRGTVRYIGPVATSKNLKTKWVGVEWDKGSTKGKADGAVQKDGVEYRYFLCQAGRASFVKPKKLIFGASLMDSLYAKYNLENLEEELAQQEDLAKETNYKWQFVGWDKAMARQCNFPKKTLVDLAGFGVDRIERPEEFAQFKRLYTIDLRRNLFTSWETLELLAGFKKLKRLDLSHNNFGTTIEAAAFKGAFLRLETLTIKDVPYAWNHVRALAAAGCFPALTTLNLEMNKLSTFATDGSEGPLEPGKIEGFPSLKRLELGANSLSWEHIEAWALVPALQHLKVQRCGIKTVRCQDGHWPAITNVNLYDNALETTEFLDALGAMPGGVQNVDFDLNPFLEVVGASKARDIAIGKIPSLKLVNNSEIDRRNNERKDAEIGYLRWAYGEYLKRIEAKEPDLGQFEECYYRSGELLSTHKGINLKADKATKRELSVVSVQIKSTEAESVLVNVPPKKLPLSMTIGKVKLLCKRLFKLPTDQQHLTVHNRGRTWPEPMPDDKKTIGHYNVREGATIHMRSKKELGK